MLFRAKKKSYNILKISKYFGVWRVYNMKKILFAASEAVPFIKTGGLADVRVPCQSILTGKSMMCASYYRSICAWTNVLGDSFILNVIFM